MKQAIWGLVMAAGKAEQLSSEIETAFLYLNDRPVLAYSLEAFNQCLSRFEFDATIATGEALQKISAFKSKPEAHLIVRVCLAIANADGHFDTTERQALEQICRALELDSKTFI